jgi:hypothetical protein
VIFILVPRVCRVVQVWDARSIRESGATRTRLNARIPYNAVLSIKLCEQFKPCPNDLVGQVCVACTSETCCV